jgi:hypothetical protein
MNVENMHGAKIKISSPFKQNLGYLVWLASRKNDIFFSPFKFSGPPVYEYFN